MADRGPSAPIGVSECIRRELGGLTTSERRLARVLLGDNPTAGLKSSARLASLAKVSPPTVSRFVSHLGFESYAAFQAALQEELEAKVMTPRQFFRRYHESSRDNGVLSSHALLLGTAVSSTLNDLPEEDFTRARGLLTDPSHSVISTGGWFSHIMAQYFVAALRRTRPSVHYVAPSAPERASSVANITSGDTVAIFDYRRYERETIIFAESVEKCGARIILFTDPWLSPTSEIADAVLTARVTGIPPFETLAPTLALIEALVSAVMDDLGEAGSSWFERSEELVDQWSYHQSEGTATSPV